MCVEMNRPGQHIPAVLRPLQILDEPLLVLVAMAHLACLPRGCHDAIARGMSRRSLIFGYVRKETWLAPRDRRKQMLPARTKSSPVRKMVPRRGAPTPKTRSYTGQRRGHARQGRPTWRVSVAITDGIGLTVAMQAMNMLDQLTPVEVWTGREDPPQADPQTSPSCRIAARGGMTVDSAPSTRARGKRVRARFSIGRLPPAPPPASPCGRRSRRVHPGRPGPRRAFAPLRSVALFLHHWHGHGRPRMDDIVAALEAQGIQVEQYYPELGHGQQSVDPSRARPGRGRSSVLYRETVRAVAYRHGLYASLAPKPFPDQAGTAARALSSGTGGPANLTTIRKGARVSRLGYHFIAGVLEHLPALLALRARRSTRTGGFSTLLELGQHAWARTIGGRRPIPSTFASGPAGSTNADLKACDARPIVPGAGRTLAPASTVSRARSSRVSRPWSIPPTTPTRSAPSGHWRFPATLAEGPRASGRHRSSWGCSGPPRALVPSGEAREWAAFSKEDAAFEQKHHFWKF